LFFGLSWNFFFRPFKTFWTPETMKNMYVCLWCFGWIDFFMSKCCPISLKFYACISQYTTLYVFFFIFFEIRNFFFQGLLIFEAASGQVDFPMSKCRPISFKFGMWISQYVTSVRLFNYLEILFSWLLVASAGFWVCFCSNWFSHL